MGYKSASSLLKARLDSIEQTYIESAKYENIIGDYRLGTGSGKWTYWSNGLTAGLNGLTNGELVGTPAFSYAEVGIRLLNAQQYAGRTLLFTCLAKTAKTGGSDGLRAKSYFYKADTQIKSNAQPPTVIIPEGQYARITDIQTLPTDATTFDNVRFSAMETNTDYHQIKVKDIMVIDITDDLSFNPDAVTGGYWTGRPPATTVKVIFDAAYESKYKGKNVLVMGDSLTAANKWQQKVASIHKCNVTTHAKGGIGITAMVDGSLPELPALDTAKVADKDVIIMFIGMNERSSAYGVKTDLYPTQTTIWGKMQYAINKVYDLLTTAGNTDCKLLVVTPHCAGKYPYVDVDGYGEYPGGTGQTLEKLSDTLKTIAQYNNIPVVDLWHDSGIGRRTWSIYTASPTAVAGTPATGTPFPNNGDQLHLSNAGNDRIGEMIAAKMNLL